MLIAFEAPPIRSVDPSGADLITYSEAMLVMAPGRFSMMNCCFRTGMSRSVSARVTRSVFPPAANGLTMRTTLGGVWAGALNESVAAIKLTSVQPHVIIGPPRLLPEAPLLYEGGESCRAPLLFLRRG